jgi:multiple sugar transport system permease protein
MGIKKTNKVSKIIIYVILLLSSAIMIIPFAWMFLTAFKTMTEATAVNPFVIFPSRWLTENFEFVLQTQDFVRLYGVTIVMIIGRVIAAILTATLAGYAFARINFFGKNVLFALVLLQMMVPVQIFIIPQFQMVSSLGQLDTMFSLLFPGLVTAFGTFLLRQSYKSLPKDLEEASVLDGCNIGQTFLFVMAPLTKASMIALGIFTAIFAYRELMWPLIAQNRVMPLSGALAIMQGQHFTHFPRLMAAALLACIPMIVIYLIFQKHFVEGIATAGGKL